MDTALSVKKREVRGSAAARRLRREGLIPVVLYGHKEAPGHYAVDSAEMQSILRSGARMVDLKSDDQTEKALIKDVQYDAFGSDVLHIDFARIGLDEKITIKIPIETRGTHAAVSEDGVLDNPLKALEVECLPGDIPENILVDISGLQMGDSIYVKDLDIPEGVSPLDDPETLVIAVSAPREEKEEEVAEEGAEAEPEIIEKGKTEEAETQAGAEE